MFITLDSESRISITRQLYMKIRAMILDGSMISGARLPSSRELANELSISRNTVLEAYDQLIAEGYLEGHHGSKTVVASGIMKQSSAAKTGSAPDLLQPTLMNYTRIDFRSGVPDLEVFPRAKWAKLYQQTIQDLSANCMRYYQPAGVPELRNAIAQYLFRTRGISCSPAGIMIVSGSTQGLSLISKLLYKKKQEVITEDPTHPGLLNVISSAGYSITAVPADEKGIDTSVLTPSEQVAFLYTTPSHQYPLGGILPIQRRLSLLQYAKDNDCYVVEDDYDSEFRFEGQPVSSLYELNPSKVIYIGSFSKILAPALRLGFLLLPPELINDYCSMKMYSDVHTEAISQYVLANFIQSGELERHIWKMKKLYSRKREHLRKELEAYFRGEYEIRGHAAGLHVIVHFYDVVFTKELTARLYAKMVKVYPVENYVVKNFGQHETEIILGYSHLSFEKISTGIRILSDVIHKSSLVE